MARLKAKRFSQIFNYLDQDQAGVIDLLDLATSKTLFDITSLSSVSRISDRHHIIFGHVLPWCTSHQHEIVTAMLDLASNERGTESQTQASKPDSGLTSFTTCCSTSGF